MTERGKNFLLFWLLIGAVLLVMYAKDSKGASFTVTRDSWEDTVWYDHYAECDSARACYGYPSVSNLYEKVKLHPVSASDGYTLIGAGLSLDSIGLHAVRIWYWLEGSTDSSYTDAYNYHEGPRRGTPTAPSGASLCGIWGNVYGGSGIALVGATITAIRTSSYPAIDTSGGNSFIISSAPVYAYTDTLGFFQMDLFITTHLSDTTKGFYNIVGQYDGREIFSLKKIYIPDTTSFDLTDTILARGH